MRYFFTELMWRYFCQAILGIIEWMPFRYVCWANEELCGLYMLPVNMHSARGTVCRRLGRGSGEGGGASGYLVEVTERLGRLIVQCEHYQNGRHGGQQRQERCSDCLQWKHQAESSGKFPT